MHNDPTQDGFRFFSLPDDNNPGNPGNPGNPDDDDDDDEGADRSMRACTCVRPMQAFPR